ncbi:hypothetical protein [Paeniglutamicibacter sp.]|uniref:hypothetical protein n=1 Tax=Paeniglutamicibacter sp. TaxID=1934391 RepID=UPI00398A2E72
MANNKIPGKKAKQPSASAPGPGKASDSEQRAAADPSPGPTARAGDEPSNQLSKKTIGRLIRVPLTSPKAWIFILAWSIPAVSIAAYVALPSVQHLVDTVLGGFWLVISVEIPAYFFTTGATLIVAAVAWRALKQKQAADRKSEWWRRTQYALDQLVSGNRKSNFLGTDLIEFLARDHDDNPELVDEADRVLFKEVIERLPMLISSEDKMEKNAKEEKT